MKTVIVNFKEVFVPNEATSLQIKQAALGTNIPPGWEETTPPYEQAENLVLRGYHPSGAAEKLANDTIPLQFSKFGMSRKKKRVKRNQGKEDFLGSGRSRFNTAPDGWMNANEIRHAINKERATMGWKYCTIVQVLYGLPRLCPGLDWVDISDDYPLEDYREVSSNSNWRSLPDAEAAAFMEAMQNEQAERQAAWAKQPKRTLRETLIKTRGSRWWDRPRSTWGKPSTEWPDKYWHLAEAGGYDPDPPADELSEVVKKTSEGLKVVWINQNNGFYRPDIEKSDMLSEYHYRDGRPLMLVDKPGRRVIKAWPKVDEMFEELIDGVTCSFFKNPTSRAYEHSLSADELEEMIST